MSLYLGDRICEFLISTGGAYKELTGDIQRNVFHALGSKQYVMKEDETGIVYFVSYWKVRPEEIVDVADRVHPQDITHGSVMYVSEAGNKGGKKAMAEIITRLREQATGLKGLFWHRPAKADKVYYFPSQRGKGA